MAEPKFTPGPWRVGFEDGSGRGDESNGAWIVPINGENRAVVAVGDNGGCMVGVCSGLSIFDKSRSIVRAANAHLIAAAPEMYAELEYLQWSDNGRCPRCGVEGMLADHLPDCSLNNILKQARGE